MATSTAISINEFVGTDYKSWSVEINILFELNKFQVVLLYGVNMR